MSPIEKFVYGGLVISLLAAASIVWSISRDAKARNRRSGWPRVRGNVLEHRLRRDGLHRAFMEVRLEYEYDGAPYERWIGSADPRGMDAAKEYIEKTLLERMAERHPIGSELKVIVSPDDRRQAYLVERELSGAMYVGVVAALFAAGFAFLLYVGREFVQ
jgi:hypothetical protein